MQEHIRQMQAHHLTYALDKLGETATINGQEGVPVVPTPRTRGRSTDDYGDMPTAAMSLFCRTSGFVTAPAAGQPVTFRDRDYRIADIQRNSGEEVMILILQDVSE